MEEAYLEGLSVMAENIPPYFPVIPGPVEAGPVLGPWEWVIVLAIVVLAGVAFNWILDNI